MDKKLKGVAMQIFASGSVEIIRPLRIDPQIEEVVLRFYRIGKLILHFLYKQNTFSCVNFRRESAAFHQSHFESDEIKPATS